MDEENIFWVNVWRIAAIVFIAFVLIVSGCTAHRNQLVYDMVKSGASPMEASCALSRDDRGMAICAVELMRSKP